MFADEDVRLSVPAREAVAGVKPINAIAKSQQSKYRPVPIAVWLQGLRTTAVLQLVTMTLRITAFGSMQTSGQRTTRPQA